MAYRVEKVEVWLGYLKDQPGELAGVLEVLNTAGASLEFLFGRGTAAGPAVCFLAPLKGGPQLRAAKKLGLAKSGRTRSLRITGPDKRGIGVKITRALGEAGINIRGFSAMGMGGKAMFYVALSPKDLNKAQKVLQRTL